MTTSRSISYALRGLAAFVITAGGLTLPTPDADAGPVSRPIRDTSSRTTSTSGKVLVAIPRDSNYSYLRTASHRERHYFGRPVRCGLSPYESLDDARIVVKRLPAYRRYAAGYDLCESHRAGGTVLQTVYGSDRRNRMTSASSSHTHASPAESMGSGFTIIAAGQTKRADLPAAMQNDGWALLNNGRFRDAMAAFEEQGDLDAAGRAGHAIAMAMTGQLDSAADLLTSATLGDAAMAKLSPRLKSQLAAMAEMMEADRPDAAAVLSAMAAPDAANGA